MKVQSHKKKDNNEQEHCFFSPVLVHHPNLEVLGSVIPQLHEFPHFHLTAEYHKQAGIL